MGKHGWIKGIILGLLVAVGGWALFQLVLSLIKIPFENAGIIDPIWQYLAIVVVIVMLLVIGWGTGLKDAIKKLVR